MAPGDDVTTGELGRRLDKLEERMDDRFAGLHRRLDELAMVPNAVFNEYKRTVAVERQALADWVTNLERELGALRRDAADEKDERIKQQAANRRLAITAFAGPIITGVVVALIIAAILGGRA